MNRHQQESLIDFAHASDLATDLSRRTVLRRIAGAGLATVTVGSLVGAIPDVHAQQAPALFTGETYVGTASDPTLFVAVVLGDGEARAYLCKTPIHLPGGIDEWLTGSFTYDTLDLTADSGATLTGQFAHGAITGTATLADGTTVSFLATRAQGAAGFYSGPRAERLLRAVSSEGGSLEELVSPVPSETLALAGYDPERPVYLAAGLIVPPGSGAVGIQSVYDVGEDSDRVRVIVTNDGRHQGAGQSPSQGGFSSRGSVMPYPDIDFIMHEDIDF